jgi:hypothetical protein
MAYEFKYATELGIFVAYAHNMRHIIVMFLWRIIIDAPENKFSGAYIFKCANEYLSMDS